jgi:hypothetical protein
MPANYTPSLGKGASFARDPIEIVLPRLSNVRPRERGGWMASCPTAAHKRGDRHPSLAVDVGDNGSVIFRCFSQGCDVEGIAAAIGLSVAELFPPRPTDPEYRGGKPKLPPIPWRDLLNALETDLTACALAFADLAAGKAFSPTDAAFIAERAADLADIVREVRNGR